MKKNKVYDEVILEKQHQLSNSKVAKKLGITVSMVEKSLQVYRFREKSKPSLTSDNYKKLESLNYKALCLKHISSVSTLNKILDQIPLDASMKQIKAVLRDIKGKEIVIDVETENAIYKKCISEKETILTELKDIEDTLSSEVYKVLSGLAEDKEEFITSKKLLEKVINFSPEYSRWILNCDIPIFKSKLLISKGFIAKRNEDEKYKFFINDVDNFIEYCKEEKLNIYLKDDNIEDTEVESIYKRNLLLERRSALEESLKDINTKIYTMNNSIENTQTIDINEKKDICVYTMEYLMKNGYVTDLDYSCKGKNIDIIGIDLKKHESIFIFYYGTLGDYNNDLTKYAYNMYCSKLYILTGNIEVYKAVEKENSLGCIFYEDKQSKFCKEPKVNKSSFLNIEDIEKQIFINLWNKSYNIN